MDAPDVERLAFLMLRKLMSNDASTCGATRRSVLRAVALTCSAAAWPPAFSRDGAPAALPVPKSLQQSLSAALKADQPLVVMVSLDGCAFCKVVRTQYLVPMHHGGLPVVQVNMRADTSVLDFDATPTTHDALVRKWGVTVAPSVLFFGRGGTEVAERLRGASIPDYYAAYLEQRLSLARATLSRQ
jgi:hypothetical protein